MLMTCRKWCSQTRLGGGKDSLQQAYRGSGWVKAATGIWSHKPHGKYSSSEAFRDRNGVFLPQAEVMGSRLAWLLTKEAYNKATETQNKVKAAKRDLADRKRQLDESQAPIKSVLASVSLEPSLALSCDAFGF